MQDLKGKVAVITGGASGIGFALAERAVAEGMSVALCDIEVGALEKAAATLRNGGAKVASYRVDVSKEAEVEAAATAIYAEFGAVHLVCNNAGVLNHDKPTWEHPIADWQWLFSVNVMGVVHGIRAFVPRMLAGGQEGHIVNTASMAGLVTGRPGAAVYDASKHAVLSLSESLYRDLVITTPKLNASVLCPGAVTTNIWTAERNRPGAAPSEQPQGSGTAFTGDSFPPSEMANRVFDAVAANRFYVLGAQDEMYEWTKMGHDRMWEGRNPAVAHSLIVQRDARLAAQ